MLSGEADHLKMVFSLTRTWLESTIYLTRGDDANNAVTLGSNQFASKNF